QPYDGGKAGTGNGIHFGFVAGSKAEVDAFYKAAIAAGAQDDGKPGAREDYGEPYYGCFLRDLDGHKIEAAFWDEELAKKLGLG
ncbi:MAG: VOC family protein, partial [Parvibaculaceae bacterium]